MHSVRPEQGGAVVRAVRAIRSQGPQTPQRPTRTAEACRNLTAVHDGDGRDDVLVVEEAWRAPTRELSRVFRGVEKHPSLSVYVHGSWADDTRTPFSDLDDLVVVNEAAIISRDHARAIERWLNRVDMRFCRLDPLQHHGHWILTESALTQLDESSIPLVVLRDAVRVSGPRKVEATIRPGQTREGLIKNALGSLATIDRLHSHLRCGGLNLYEAKQLVGSFLLMPALLLQISGQRVTKRWAIENSHTVLSEMACQTIEWSSAVRSEWGRALDGMPYRAFSKLPCMFVNPHLYRRAAARLAPRFPYEQFPDLSTQAVEALQKESQDKMCSL